MGRSAVRHLIALSRSVNFVWNYANATSFHAIRDHGKWLSKFDLNKLVGGSSKELGLHSQTVQGVAEEFVTRRVQFKKRKLRWRISKGSKRSLGWIPFKKVGVAITEDKVKYCGREIKFKKHREVPETIKTGSFSEDAMGHWYLNLVVEVPVVATQHEVEEVGGDLGLKDSLVLSDGTRIENPRIFAKHEDKLGGFQRHGKRKQARRLAARIKNIRKDFLHKKTLAIVKKFRMIFIGDVSGKFLQASSGKSSTDASTGAIRSILSYKAIRHQGRVVDVSERSIASTQTCSCCFARSGPSGPGMLGVREWTCSACGAVLDRDVNAALNHLRVGSDSLKQPARAA
jgi:transposase